jgi:vacuolar protein sorting-associated protein 13A/C
VVSGTSKSVTGIAVKCDFQPFSDRSAIGQYWLKDLDNGAYRQEFYVAHISMPVPSSLLSQFRLYNMTDLPGGDGVALLTAERVLTFGTKKLRLNWDLPLAQVLRVVNEDYGIRFIHKAGTDRDKYVVIEDQKSQAWFYEQIAGVVKSFNARKRMDS